MNPIFDNNARSKWVTVSNLPREANEDWLRMLFAPAGIVESVNFALEEGTGTACLLFASADQASDALQFNGFNALGITLQVRPRSFPSDGFHQAGQVMDIVRRNLSNGGIGGNDLNTSMMPRLRNNHLNNLNADPSPTHKNLYVLNLPLDATTDQLTALFASYGQVLHCVILAMLDAQARRRGFIDMSSANEAKEAIEGLNGFVWHGYPIEVSYAIVQRSGGPFDQSSGRNIIKRNVPRNRFNTGPRRIPSDSAIDPNLMANLTQHFNRQINFGQNNSLLNNADQENFNAIPRVDRSSDPLQNGGAIVDPYTIFIAGMDPAAIIDDDDFRAALEHYGAITAATLCRDENGMSRGFGIVTFATQQAATNVCESVNGKIIDGRRLTAHKYVYQPSPSNPYMMRGKFPFVNMMPLRYPNASVPALPRTQASALDFFKPNVGNHAVEIKPAPDSNNKSSTTVKTLGDPFNPTPKVPSVPKESGTGQLVLSGSPWNSSVNSTPTNSLGLDGLSPQSVASSTSSLQTPEVLRDRDTARIWSQGNLPNRGTWATSKHANVAGSAILSLQSDIVEKKNRPSTMAPVGHEKTSSPLRIRTSNEATH